MHVCNLVLDLGADTTVIAADLVPVASYTGETLRIAGVHSIGVAFPLARLKIMIGNQKIWLKAAVVEKPPHDILLGRDCENLQQLLRDALELQAKETKETVSVVTRQQAKAEQKEITRDEHEAMMQKSGKGRKEWDLLLPMLLFAYREATHEATGFSPFELLFGRQVCGPLDLVKEQWEEIENFPLSVGNYLSNLYDKMKSMADMAKERDQAAKQKYKEFYDKGTRPRFFEEGESVLLLMPDGHSKLEACYSGPFTIERKISPVTYQIATPGRGKKSKIVETMDHAYCESVSIVYHS